MTDTLLTISQAAALLGVTSDSVRRWTDRGLIPAIKTEKQHRRYRRQDLEVDSIRELASRKVCCPHCSKVFNVRLERDEQCRLFVTSSTPIGPTIEGDGFTIN